MRVPTLETDRLTIRSVLHSDLQRAFEIIDCDWMEAPIHKTWLVNRMAKLKKMIQLNGSIRLVPVYRPNQRVHVVR